MALRCGNKLANIVDDKCHVKLGLVDQITVEDTVRLLVSIFAADNFYSENGMKFSGSLSILDFDPSPRHLIFFFLPNKAPIELKMIDSKFSRKIFFQTRMITSNKIYHFHSIFC